MRTSVQHYSDDICQAAGMVAAQADCYIEVAILQMRARAEAYDVTLEEIATAVIGRTIRFDPIGLDAPHHEARCR